MRENKQPLSNETPRRIPLSIHKTLKENLPESINPLRDEIHITENGEIHISREDGTLQQCNTGSIVTEVSNPLTITPLEYGYFKIPQQDVKRSTSKDIVNIIVSDGNIEINENTFLLKKGKTYSVSAILNSVQLKGNTTGGWWASFVDIDTNENIGDELRIVTVSHTGNIARSNSTQFIFAPQKDTKISFCGINNTLDCSIDFGAINIQEIRNNPVNQYGGFQTEVLFDGEANVVGEYELDDDVNNYDFIIVEKGKYVADAYSRILPIMTENTKPEPFKVSDMTNKNTLYKGFNDSSLDGVGWGTAKSAWCNIELDKPKAMSRIYIYALEDKYNAHSPKKIDIYGSNDGIKYEMISQISEIPPLTKGQDVTLDFENNKCYLHYKLDITEGHGSSYQGYIAFGYMQLYEKSETVWECEKNRVFHGRNQIIKDDFCFRIDNNILKIEQMDVLPVNRIIGVKGQIPSLLRGGTF